MSEEDQAVYLRQAYSYLARRGDVPVAVWFNLRDIAFPGVVRTDVGSGFGLMRPSGSRKPAFMTYRNYALNPSATMAISRPSALRVGKRALLRFAGRSRLPRRLEAFAAPKKIPCAPTAAVQAAQPGSRRLLRSRSVPAGPFSQLVELVPSRAGERACGYLSESSTAVPDATADTLMPLPTPPGKRCPSLIFDAHRSSVAGIVVEGRACSRVRVALSRWENRGFEPRSAPSGYSCAISMPDDVGRRAYACRGAGGGKLSFLLWRFQAGT